jgi:P4 family phage/plasmid primase-like protien
MKSDIKYFTRKKDCKSSLLDGKIIGNLDIKKYFHIQGYQEFLDLIIATKDTGVSPLYYEYIPDNIPVKLFFDIEIFLEKHLELYDSPETVIDTIENLFGDEYILLESPKLGTKKSFHVIFPNIHFENVLAAKKFVTSFKELEYFVKEKIIDPCVYREGLFRTLYSSKNGENRILEYSDKSPIQDADIDTFICYITNPQFNMTNSVLYEQSSSSQVGDSRNISRVNIPTLPTTLVTSNTEITRQDASILQHFVRKNYNFKVNDISSIVINTNNNCIIIALNDKFCDNIDREHKSNHQYIVLDGISSKQKCHDPDCKGFKKNEIKSGTFPDNVKSLLHRYLKINENEMKLIQDATNECTEYIRNFDEKIENIQFDKSLMMFKGNASDNSIQLYGGKCANCKAEHQINPNGYCIKCTVCPGIFPKKDLIQINEKYRNLTNFWQIINPVVNVTVTNNYNNSEDNFSCDISIDESIFKNGKLSSIINQILDGHKIAKLSQLMKHQNDNFVFDNNVWYHFDGHIWNIDTDSIQFKKSILGFTTIFDKIILYYTNKNDDVYVKLINNIKCLITKLNKPGVQEDIVKTGKLFFHQKDFRFKLNSKKHLIPFKNGVFDLLDRKFRKTRKDDYINLTLGFDYDINVRNEETIQFVNNILPNKAIRDYVIKKFSECLNGDIPNTYFLMFIGDGANGKSQILNLMKHTMGELGEKVEVTLLTRKRNNANEANTEKAKLINKRFAFLSEPEDGEKINISLLKELTGSEEIVARGLYQDSVSFVMEAKLFLACNELPDIKGEDTALWRRIRVIDFPSRFVDEPKESNEFKIDRTLPARMREDITWRQTFFNMLLEIHFTSVPEPKDVQAKTNAYRDNNNEIESWCKENIVIQEGFQLLSIDAAMRFYQKTVITSKEKTKMKDEIDKYITKFLKHQGIEKNDVHKFNQTTRRCWKNLKLSDI